MASSSPGPMAGQIVAITHDLGFPRIGAKREPTFALESRPGRTYCRFVLKLEPLLH